jgi:hypothetical protein
MFSNLLQLPNFKKLTLSYCGSSGFPTILYEMQQLKEIDIKSGYFEAKDMAQKT